MDNIDRKQGNMAGKNTLFVIVFLGFCLTTTACGFQPLYSHSNEGGASAAGSVKILNIKNRSGQKLRNFLLERMSQGTPYKKRLYSFSSKFTRLG